MDSGRLKVSACLLTSSKNSLEEMHTFNECIYPLEQLTMDYRELSICTAFRN